MSVVSSMPVETALQQPPVFRLDLLRQGQQGDDLAFERFVIGQLRLVAFVLSRLGITPDSQDWWDMFQVGCIGLIQACRRFDVERGVAFSSYAIPMIAGMVRRYRREHGSTLGMRLPRCVQDGTVILLDAERQGYDMSRDRAMALLDQAGITGDDARLCLDWITMGVMSLDDMPSPDPGDDPRRLEEVLPDCREDVAERATIAQLARQWIQQLDARDRQIVYLRVVIGLSQYEIAQRMGISQASVSRILKRALTFNEVDELGA